MCSVIAAVGGLLTGLQGYASYQSNKEAIQAQADSQASMYRAQAQQAEHNAKIESKRQEQIADQYGEEAKRLRARQRLSEGRVRAGAGAAGLDVSGSVMDVLSSGQEAYVQDQMTLLGNQRNDNYVSRVQQSNYLNEAGSNRAAATNVLSDARRQISALRTSTILGTAASMVPFFSGIGGKSTGGAATTSGTTSGTSTSIPKGWNASTGNYTLGQDYTFGATKYATPLDRYLDKSFGTNKYNFRLG